MKKYLTLILFTSLFYSCGQTEFYDLKAPIIVVAIKNPCLIDNGDFNSYHSDGAIVVRDINNKYWSSTGEYALPAAIIASYEVGDTLK